MRKMNRCFASTISFFMLAGLLPTNVQADLKDNTMLTAVELEGTSLLDELEGNINEVKGQALYGDDEFVTAIVELEEAPVMDYYDSSSYFSLDEENSAGESVSKFLASDDIKEVSEELLDNQKNIISEITFIKFFKYICQLFVCTVIYFAYYYSNRCLPVNVVCAFYPHSFCHFSKK